MGNEDLPLVLGKLLESFIQQIEQQISRIDRVRTCLYRWQQVFERERFLLRDRLVQRDRLLFTKQIRDTVSSNTKQPRSNLLHRLHKAISLKKFVEDILKDVLRVSSIEHTPANETS